MILFLWDDFDRAALAHFRRDWRHRHASRCLSRERDRSAVASTGSLTQAARSVGLKRDFAIAPALALRDAEHQPLAVDVRGL